MKKIKKQPVNSTLIKAENIVCMFFPVYTENLQVKQHEKSIHVKDDKEFDLHYMNYKHRNLCLTAPSLLSTATFEYHRGQGLHNVNFLTNFDVKMSSTLLGADINMVSEFTSHDHHVSIIGPMEGTRFLLFSLSQF